MKKTIALSVFMVILFHYPVKAQGTDTLYKIATWKGFAQSAVSYTWDDNTPKQLSDALPLYDRYGFKATFFPITSLNPNWNGLKQAQNNGHEIGSHTVTHTSLNTLSDSSQQAELKNSQLEVNTQLLNSKCITLAYPFCVRGNTAITTKYYISARGCNGQVEKKTPADFLYVNAIVCGTQGQVNTAQHFNGIINNAIVVNGWAVFLLHGINNDGGFSPVDSIELSGHLQYMNDHRNQSWIDTYGNVVRYIRERDITSVHELSATDSLITFSVTHPLDTTIYNFPLTLKRRVPDNWNAFTVWQNGKQIPVRMVIENGKQHLIAEVIPNTGNISIRRNGTTDIVNNSIVSSFTIYPNPFAAFSTIRFELERTAFISIELLDESGKKIRNIKTGTYSAGLHEELLDGDGLRGKIFFCAIYGEGKLLIRKVICSTP